ncbi:hypothetical protein CAMRE0001_1569 [Campylobacter rectus RM3267]|uniref:Uncharacterized protein n=1 Tax=Campylobacter rectus RM3267 TaxID=553218 RepID=B9CYZ6_CAMRE|nr:hypothetical protein CAMRE0001_1569 [Campylobacter rectus RM3267]
MPLWRRENLTGRANNQISRARLLKFRGALCFCKFKRGFKFSKT